MGQPSWDDKTVPVGSRKVSFVRWLMKKGRSRSEAKLIYHRRFKAEEQEALEIGERLEHQGDAPSLRALAKMCRIYGWNR